MQTQSGPQISAQVCSGEGNVRVVELGVEDGDEGTYVTLTPAEALEFAERLIRAAREAM